MTGRTKKPAALVGRRVYQLDAIRGLLAIGVMGYHVLGWPDVFGTWGVYAFFVLSGWAMDHVYRERFELRRFVVARVARLAPLWVPVVLVSAFLYGADPGRILLNVTGAFGFVLPGETSIVTGGWSIGIEVVCYAVFPVLVRLQTRWLVIVAAGAVLARLAWTGVMPANLTTEWVRYTQAQSFLCFFLVGMLCARTVRLQAWKGPRARLSTLLGGMSYGTYLLHPIVALAVGPWAMLVTPPLALAIRYGYEIPAGLRIREEAHEQAGRAARGLERIRHRHRAVRGLDEGGVHMELRLASIDLDRCAPGRAIIE